MSLAERLDRLIERISVPQHQQGLRYTRTIVGWIVVYILTINWAQRHVLLGPNGILDQRMGFSLFNLTTTALTFDLLYVLGVLGAFLFALGIGGRLTTLFIFCFFWSWTSRSALIGDGGDNILRIMLAYMLMVDLHGKLPERPSKPSQYILGLLHNAGLLAMGLQISILYMTAGLQKAQGDMWRDGTALFYVLQVQMFSNPSVAGLLLKHSALMVASTYATIFYQLAFPYLLLHRKGKLWVIAVSWCFHLGILVSMNLVSFSLIMMTMELCLLSNADYERLLALIRDARRWLARWFTGPDHNGKLIVYLDGDCVYCRATGRAIRRLDRFRWIDIQSFRQDDSYKIYGLQLAAIEAAMHTVVLRGDGYRVVSGFPAVIQVLWRLPLLWICLPVAWFLQAVGLGPHIYRRLADNRIIVPDNKHCLDGACPLPAPGEPRSEGQPL